MISSDVRKKPLYKPISHYVAQLKEHIDLVGSFLENRNFSTLIKICRLRPKKYRRRLILHEDWLDEFGNVLNIKKKNISILLNVPGLNKADKTDLYHQLPIEKIYLISKMMYVLSGKEEDFGSDTFIVSFLGWDNYLRTYVYSYGEWQSCSSLLLGIAILLEIINNMEMTEYKEIKSSGPVIFPCESQREWLTCIPVSKDFETIMKLDNEVLSSIFKGN